MHGNLKAATPVAIIYAEESVVRSILEGDGYSPSTKAVEHVLDCDGHEHTSPATILTLESIGYNDRVAFSAAEKAGAGNPIKLNAFRVAEELTHDGNKVLGTFKQVPYGDAKRGYIVSDGVKYEIH